MGFFDALLAGSKGKLKAAAPDRLFAMTTANITLETGRQGYELATAEKRAEAPR